MHAAGTHPSSKRTWSLPLPVAPCETASAPTWAAISIWRLAMSGLAMEVPSRYTPSYREFALQQDLSLHACDSQGRVQTWGCLPEHGEHVVAHELLLQVIDEYVLDARSLGLGARRLYLLALRIPGRVKRGPACLPQCRQLCAPGLGLQ